jgi:hypothetical protein
MNNDETPVAFPSANIRGLSQRHILALDIPANGLRLNQAKDILREYGHFSMSSKGDVQGNVSAS